MERLQIIPERLFNAGLQWMDGNFQDPHTNMPFSKAVGRLAEEQKRWPRDAFTPPPDRVAPSRIPPTPRQIKNCEESVREILGSDRKDQVTEEDGRYALAVITVIDGLKWAAGKARASYVPPLFAGGVLLGGAVQFAYAMWLHLIVHNHYGALLNGDGKETFRCLDPRRSHIVHMTPLERDSWYPTHAAHHAYTNEKPSKNAQGEWEKGDPDLAAAMSLKPAILTALYHLLDLMGSMDLAATHAAGLDAAAARCGIKALSLDFLRTGDGGTEWEDLRKAADAFWKGAGKYYQREFIEDPARAARAGDSRLWVTTGNVAAHVTGNIIFSLLAVLTTHYLPGTEYSRESEGLKTKSGRFFHQSLHSSALTNVPPFLRHFMGSSYAHLIHHVDPNAPFHQVLRNIDRLKAAFAEHGLPWRDVTTKDIVLAFLGHIARVPAEELSLF